MQRIEDCGDLVAGALRLLQDGVEQHQRGRGPGVKPKLGQQLIPGVARRIGQPVKAGSPGDMHPFGIFAQTDQPRA